MILMEKDMREVRSNAGKSRLLRLHYVHRPSITSCIFSVSTFKGLLSIPCDGRGARRPLGQSFRESVGPPGSRWPAEAREGIARHNYRTLIEPSFPRFWIPRGSDAADDPSPGKRGAVITSESPRPGHYGTLEGWTTTRALCLRLFLKP